MKKTALGNRLTPVLLLLCGLLLAILVSVSRDSLAPGRKEPLAAQPDTGADRQPAKRLYRAPAIDTFNEILERPLFSEDRAPPPIPEPVPAAAPLRAPLRLILEGVAIASDARVAVLRDPANNKILRLAVGDTHAGWVVEDVHPKGATFRQGKRIQELTLALEKDNGRKR